MQPLRPLLSLTLILVAAVAHADAHDPLTDVPRVHDAGAAKGTGITSVECEAPTGTPRVARCVFFSVSLNEGSNHTCTLSTRTNDLQMTQIDADTWRNDWPASGPCKQASSTLLLRSKKNRAKWTVKDTTTVPRLPPDAPKDTHSTCDERVGTHVEINNAEAHHPRKVDCEFFDL